jgi:hypothetical protein
MLIAREENGSARSIVSLAYEKALIAELGLGVPAFVL